jgi:hypothetical protein
MDAPQLQFAAKRNNAARALAHKCDFSEGRSRHQADQAAFSNKNLCRTCVVKPRKRCITPSTPLRNAYLSFSVRYGLATGKFFRVAEYTMQKGNTSGCH